MPFGPLLFEVGYCLVEVSPVGLEPPHFDWFFNFDCSSISTDHITVSLLLPHAALVEAS